MGSVDNTAEHEVRYRLTRDGLEGPEGVALVSATPSEVVLDVGGLRRRFEVAAYPGLSCVDSAQGSVALVPVERFADPADQVAAGSLLAPMPGTVVRIAVEAGDAVTTGQPLLWLEAMKMQHRIESPADGVVAELGVSVGDQVEVGRVLAVVSSEEES